jgi:hypothetical protein
MKILSYYIVLIGMPTVRQCRISRLYRKFVRYILLLVYSAVYMCTFLRIRILIIKVRSYRAYSRAGTRVEPIYILRCFPGCEAYIYIFFILFSSVENIGL